MAEASEDEDDSTLDSANYWAGWTLRTRLLVFGLAAAGIVMAGVGPQPVRSLGLVLLGSLLLHHGYFVHRTGVSKSNWGIARRKQEPIGVHFDLLVVLACGVVLVAAGIVMFVR